MAEIVAVIPYWSQSDAMNFDSNYSFLRQVVPKMAEARPDWYWLVFWPYSKSGADKWRYTPDGFFTDHILPVRWPYDTSRSSSIMAFDVMRYQQVDDLCAPTIYWIQQVESAVMFRRGYRDSRSDAVIPRVVVQHHYTAHATRESDAIKSPSAFLQMIGLLTADRVVANSQYAAKMARETFGLYLNFNTMDTINKKTTVLPFGLVPPSLPETHTYPKPVVLYNHRFEDYKQPEITKKVLQHLKEKFDFEVWITQTVGQGVGDFPFDKGVGAASRDEYLERIAVPAINTMNSRHETFCISILDSMMSGHLCVVPKSLAFPEIMPPDYPYLFTSTTEQVAMLSAILSSWPKEWEAWSPRLKAHAKQAFSLDGYAKSYVELLEREGAVWKNVTAKENTAAGTDAAWAYLKKAGKPVPIKELANVVKRVAGIQGQAYSNRRAVRELTDRGARILYQNDQTWLKAD